MKTNTRFLKSASLKTAVLAAALLLGAIDLRAETNIVSKVQTNTVKAAVKVCSGAASEVPCFDCPVTLKTAPGAGLGTQVQAQSAGQAPDFGEESRIRILPRPRRFTWGDPDSDKINQTDKRKGWTIFSYRF